ncbi:MAG: hypothetical protein JO116_15085, partial [Planctomycetaceae bacterium]|nr:hypothetical protein [Planctomycetaceae bacterium]
MDKLHAYAYLAGLARKLKDDNSFIYRDAAFNAIERWTVPRNLKFGWREYVQCYFSAVAGDLGGARAYSERLKNSPNFARPAYSVTAVAAAEAGDRKTYQQVTTALASLPEVPHGNLRSFYGRNLAIALAKGGEIEEAQARGNNINNIKYHEQILHAVAEKQAKNGDVEAAKKTLASICDSLERGEVCRSIAA